MPRPERQLIERVRKLARNSKSGRRTIITGIGDDCAVIRPPAGHELLVTTDFSLEGVHFRRDWHPPQSVGHRCLTRGLSDIAAMGGEPLAVFLSLALPTDLPQRWVDGFYSGLLALAERFRVALAGGDTAQSSAGVLADIMVLGSLPRGKAVLRSGAKPGDRIYVTGKLGESAAEIRRRYAEGDRGNTGSGLHSDVRREAEDADVDSKRLARNVSREAAKDVSPARKRWERAPKNSPSRGSGDMGRFLYPEPRLPVGQKLRGIASSMIDISDGLSTDLSHICEESKVGAILNQSAIPIADTAALDDALYGGDDYELLFTSSKRVPREIAGVAIEEIGEIVKRSGMWIRDDRGRERIVKAKGWEHFRG